MPTPTYDILASSVLASATDEVLFNSITGQYRDLVVICDYKAESSSINGRFLLNSNQSNYNLLWFAVDSSTQTPYSNIQTNRTIGDLNYYETVNSSNKCIATLTIFDYTNSNIHKTCLIEVGNIYGSLERSTVRWANTSAVTSISLRSSGGNFAIGARFYLYGIG